MAVIEEKLLSLAVVLSEMFVLNANKKSQMDDNGPLLAAYVRFLWSKLCETC